MIAGGQEEGLAGAVRIES